MRLIDFFNNISTVNGHAFIVDNKRIDVTVFNDVTCGSARIDSTAENNSPDIVNIHFNFIPTPSISPSHNLLDLWERINVNEQLRNTIKGISLRLNVAQKTLYFYGSFLMSDQAFVDATLISLRDAGIRANRASFVSFLLRDTDATHLCNLGGGMFVANEFLSLNNILTNLSTIDRLSQGGGDSDLRSLIPSIVDEVLRNLRGNNINNNNNNNINHAAIGNDFPGRRRGRRGRRTWYRGGNRRPY